MKPDRLTENYIYYFNTLKPNINFTLMYDIAAEIYDYICDISEVQNPIKSIVMFVYRWNPSSDKNIGLESDGAHFIFQ